MTRTPTPKLQGTQKVTAPVTGSPPSGGPPSHVLPGAPGGSANFASPPPVEGGQGVPAVGGLPPNLVIAATGSLHFDANGRFY